MVILGTLFPNVHYLLRAASRPYLASFFEIKSHWETTSPSIFPNRMPIALPQC